MTTSIKTEITDENISEFVNLYLQEPDSIELPTDLKETPIGDWDVSEVTDMSWLFSEYVDFNEPLNNWVVDKVVDMNHMFENCENFDQPLDKWKVNIVQDMTSMFSGCKKFNQPLNTWVVSDVTNMSSMFNHCNRFNQSLNSWVVDGVENMNHMFEQCTDFNQPLDTWRVNATSGTSYMFAHCLQFNQPLHNWRIEDTTQNMFDSCKTFNSPLTNWDVSTVVNMANMFSNCHTFNQPLDDWEVDEVQHMDSMFFNCEHFDQPLPHWDIELVNDIDYIFENCPISDENKPPRFRNELVVREPVVDPYQIHKESAKVNYHKLVEVFHTALPPSTVVLLDTFLDETHENREYGHYIDKILSKMVNLSEDAKTLHEEQRRGLDRIMQERLHSVQYSDFSKLLIKTIFYTLEYVLTQPADFQKEYVHTFIQECVHAYNGPDGMTCVGGALERIVNSLVLPCQTALTLAENEEYRKITDIISANPMTLIPVYILDWYRLHKVGTADAFSGEMTDKHRKANLREYLIDKFPTEDNTKIIELIDDKIMEIADNIGYDDEVFVYGGRRRPISTVSRRPALHTRRQNRTKRSSKRSTKRSTKRSSKRSAKRSAKRSSKRSTKRSTKRSAKR